MMGHQLDYQNELFVTNFSLYTVDPFSKRGAL
jgi:hypothetical protein